MQPEMFNLAYISAFVFFMFPAPISFREDETDANVKFIHWIIHLLTIPLMHFPLYKSFIDTINGRAFKNHKLK